METANLSAHLAESVERPSPTEIVFHLKHGVRFSDGRALTARDVMFTYHSVLAPESMSPKRASLEQLKTIDAPDDYTIIMTTAHPYAPALEIGDARDRPRRHSAARRTERSRARRQRTVSNGAITSATKRSGSSAIRTFRIRRRGPVDSLEDCSRPDCARARTGRRCLRLLGKQYRVRRFAVARRHQSLEVSKTPGTTYRYLSFNFRDPSPARPARAPRHCLFDRPQYYCEYYVARHRAGSYWAALA